MMPTKPKEICAFCDRLFANRAGKVVHERTCERRRELEQAIEREAAGVEVS